MPPIPFSEIPVSFLVPGVFMEFDPSRASSGLPLQPYRGLVIAQKTSAGSAAVNTPIDFPNEEQAEALFGVGSMAARMARRFREENRFTDLHVIALADNPAGLAATGTLTFTVPSGSAAGTLVLYIGGERIPVLVSGNAVAVAAVVRDAINADPTLPLTAAVNPGLTHQVILTARNAGEVGNTIDLRHTVRQGEVFPTNLTLVVGSMAGGTGNPSLAAAIVAMGDLQYNVIAFPYIDNASLTALELELAARWGPMRAIEGVAISAAAGSVGTLQAIGALYNSAFLCIVGLEPFAGIPCERAARIAGKTAFHAEQDPSLPLQAIEIAGIAPPEADRFTLEERQMLLEDGISTLRVQPGGAVALERLVTLRTQNASGLPDTALQDVEDVLALGFIRFSFVARMTSLYPRHKLAEKLSPVDAEGDSVLTPMEAKAATAAWYQQLMARGIVQDLTGFLADSRFEINGSNPNRLDVLLAPRLTGQLRTIGVLAQFRQ